MRRAVSLGELKQIIRKMDGRGYGSYKRLLSIAINYGTAELYFTKVQGDPHAPPSIAEVVLPYSTHGLPEELLRSDYSAPLTDFIARELYKATKGIRRKCGSGYSCYIGIPKPGPWILKRSCVEISGKSLILRFYVGLPARGRRVFGPQATTLLIEDIPKVIERIVGVRTRLRELRNHIRNYVDQEYLRKWLYDNGYVGFVGNGSVLPRESSISEKPMKNAVPFKSPKAFEVVVRLPSGRVVRGMGISEGLTVVTGGGYHGKTTLLESLQEGIYNHVAGDGREYVASRKYTVTVKAEDGRIVTHVDISSLVRGLPSGEDTSNFTSLDASGSTSMGASISEVIEAGAEVILIDEDTSATNLLYKDDIMSKLVSDDPIRTLDKQVKDLIKKTGVSVVAVMSASSSFLGVADKVIRMRKYLPEEITNIVKRGGGDGAGAAEYEPPKERVFNGVSGIRKVKSSGYKIVAEYVDGEKFELDLSYYPRVVEKGQVKFIASIIKRVSRVRKPMRIRELIDFINGLVSERSFSAFTDPVPPDLTVVDGFDVVWVLNRFYRAVFTQV